VILCASGFDAGSERHYNQGILVGYEAQVPPLEADQQWIE